MSEVPLYNDSVVSALGDAVKESRQDWQV